MPRAPTTKERKADETTEVQSSHDGYEVPDIDIDGSNRCVHGHQYANNKPLNHAMTINTIKLNTNNLTTPNSLAQRSEWTKQGPSRPEAKKDSGVKIVAVRTQYVRSTINEHHPNKHCE